MSNTTRTRILLIPLITLMLGFVFGYFSFIPVRRAFASIARTKTDTALQQWIGESLPEGSMTDYKGESWSPINEEDTVRVLVFWSVSCSSCLEELEKFNELFAKYGKRKDFFMTGILRQKDMELSSCICEVKQVNWPQFFEPDSQDPYRLSAQLGIRGIPSVWVIDRDAVIRAAHISPDKLPDILEELFTD